MKTVLNTSMRANPLRIRFPPIRISFALPGIASIDDAGILA